MHQSSTFVELPPLQEHPVYIQGLAQISAGQWSHAVTAFESLQPLYPGDRELKELLNEAQMRATLSRFQPEEKSKNHKRLGLPWLMAGILAVVILVIAGYATYELWIAPVIMQEWRLGQITDLRTKADEAIAAGDYTLARQSLQELQTILPQDPETVEMLERVERVEKLSHLYDEAKSLMAANSWDQAVETLTELQHLDAQYRDLQQLLQTAQAAQTLDRQFRAAEETLAQEDWPKAIAQYQALQQADLTFRFDEVQMRLFESHLKYGQALLAEVGSEPDQAAKALEQFAEALKLRPLETEALTERRLAETYLTALQADDQDQVIELLQTIYNEQPAYAGQAAAQRLYLALLERADAFLKEGDTAAARADYQTAAQLLVKDPSAAQQKLAELKAQ